MSYVLTDEEEQIVAEGGAAGRLLDDPMFILAIDRVRAQCADLILKSNPQDREAREDAYNLSRGLSAITSELDALTARALTVIAQAETHPSAGTDHQPDVEPADY